MSSPEPVTYLFYGQDEPSLKERLAEFLSTYSEPETADLNTTRLDGTAIQIGEIETAAGTLPFLAERRIVIVENLTANKDAKDMAKGVGEVLARLPNSTRLAFIETRLGDSGGSQAEQKRHNSRQSTLKKLINAVENDPRGRVLAFDLPRNPVEWIQTRAKRHGAPIEVGAAQELAERIGEDLTLADNEIVKLATYAIGRSITVQDVQELTPYTPEASIFHMVDALGQRQGDQALRLLRQLLDAGDEPLRVFGMIIRQYRLLLGMKEQLDKGQTVNSAARALGVKHDFIARKLAAQARNYSLELLDRIYHHLLEVDLSMKTGEVEPGLALEQLVARLGS